MKIRKIIWTLVLIIAIIVCIGAILYLAKYMAGGNNEYETRDVENSTTVVDGVALAKNYLSEKEWNSQIAGNSDIYAWIYIPNTEVDYPIVQAVEEGNRFYLDHNSKKQYDTYGAIYTENHNTRDFSDSVTLVYGHNMINGSMFASLHKFEDSKFFEKNQHIYVYMPKRKLTYKIYAAYVYDNRHILNSFDFSDQKVLKKYFKYTQNPDSLTKNVRKLDKPLTVEDKIITLSTCTNGSSNTRYLVQGVLIKDEQTN